MDDSIILRTNDPNGVIWIPCSLACFYVFGWELIIPWLPTLAVVRQVIQRVFSAFRYLLHRRTYAYQTTKSASRPRLAIKRQAFLPLLRQEINRTLQIYLT